MRHLFPDVIGRRALNRDMGKISVSDKNSIEKLKDINLQREEIYTRFRPKGRSLSRFHSMRSVKLHLRDGESLIDPSDMLHFIFGTSFLHHSKFLIQITHPPLSDLQLNMPV